MPVGAQPVSPEDFLERAREHFERRRFLNALESLRVTLQMSEDLDARTYATKRDAEILSAECLAALGRTEEAANMYERADAHGYNDKKVLAFLALYFDRRKYSEKAIGYFERYYAIDKTDIATHIRYAALLGKLGDREKAKQVLESSEPVQNNGKPEMCALKETQKKYREALDCYRLVLAGRPDKEKNYLAVYRVARTLRDTKLALEYAELLHQIFGGETRYIWPLIETRLAQKKFYEARILLEEITRTNSADKDAERLLANLRNEAGPAMEKPWRANRKEREFLK